jgi:hypothetical protein
MGLGLVGTSCVRLVPRVEDDGGDETRTHINVIYCMPA